MQRPKLYIDITGPDENIYFILAKVSNILKERRRTNDFKNRLATVENQQKIDEARTDLELFRSLQEINQDQLLAQDEFDKFYMVLSRERRIREAQSALNEAQAMDQVQASLDEIQRTGLLRQEEMEIMKFQIQERAYKRGFAVKLMQLTDAAEYEKSRLGSEQELEMMKLAHQLEIVQAQDKLEEERFYKALQRRQDEQRANLYLESHSFKTAISDLELEPEIFYEMLKLKSSAIRNYVYTRIPKETFNHFLKDFFVAHQFQNIPFSTLEQELEAQLGINLNEYLEEWYNIDHSPTIFIYHFSSKTKLRINGFCLYTGSTQHEAQNNPFTFHVIFIRFHLSSVIGLPDRLPSLWLPAPGQLSANPHP